MIRLFHKGQLRLTSNANPSRKIAILTFISISCIVYFFFVVAILHVLRTDYSPIRQAVSNYAVGQYGFLMTSGFFALSLGMFTLALGLTEDLMLTYRAIIAMRLFYAASVGLAIVGIFPGDVNVPHPPATITGYMHWIAAGISFLSIMIATFLLSYCFKKDDRWQSFHRPALTLAWTTVAALAVFGILVLIGWIGIGERIYIAASLLWPLLAAIRLWTHAAKKRQPLAT